MNVAEEIAKIVRRVSAEAPEDERVHALLKEIRALPGIVELNGPLAFRSGNVEIQVGLAGQLEKNAQALKGIKTLNLSLAPEVVAEHALNSGEAVLVTRYAACEGENLAPLRPTESGISADARSKALADLERLAGRGQIHPYAGRGFAPWLVSSDTKTLVLEGWSALRAANAEESSEQIKRVGVLFERLPG